MRLKDDKGQLEKRRPAHRSREETAAAFGVLSRPLRPPEFIVSLTPSSFTPTRLTSNYLCCRHGDFLLTSHTCVLSVVMVVCRPFPGMHTAVHQHAPAGDGTELRTFHLCRPHR